MKAWKAWKAWKAFVALPIAAGLLLTNQSPLSAAKEEQIFRIANYVTPGRLDPNLAGDSVTETVINGLFEGLVRENPYGKVVPGMAESWKMSGDGKTYDFTLRTGATWSTGQPVKAGDFEYAWKSTLSPSSEAAYAYQLYVLANAEAYHAGTIKDASKIGVKAINDKLLRVTLTRSTPAFLHMLAWMTFDPVNAANAKQHPDWAEHPETMVTNGPFNLKSWTNDGIVLEKNPSYYAANEISFSEVRMTGYRSLGYGAHMPTEGYLKGAYDWIGGTETPDLQSVDRETLLSDHKSFPIGASYYYQFNMTKAPFNNAKIRKALSLAVSRNELGVGTPAFGIIPPSIAGGKGEFRSEAPDTAYFSEDSKKAKQLLAEGMKEAGITKLPVIKIAVNEGSHERIAQTVAAQWQAKLGVKAVVDKQDWSVLLSNRSKHNYQMMREGWGADYNDPATFLDKFTSGNKDNDSAWSSPLYDKYMNQARFTYDPIARTQLYAKAEKLLIDQMVILPLYYYVADVLSKPYVKGVKIGYDGSVQYTRGYLAREQ